jgi:hypothetical protein
MSRNRDLQTTNRNVCSFVRTVRPVRPGGTRGVGLPRAPWRDVPIAMGDAPGDGPACTPRWTCSTRPNGSDERRQAFVFPVEERAPMKAVRPALELLPSPFTNPDPQRERRVLPHVLTVAWTLASAGDTEPRRELLRGCEPRRCRDRFCHRDRRAKHETHMRPSSLDPPVVVARRRANLPLRAARGFRPSPAVASTVA